MLIRFIIENFSSFRESTEFSMYAGKSNLLPHHIVKNDSNGLKLLRNAIIYGANASGKSNLIKAMAFAQNFIVQGIKVGRTIPVNRFKLDPEMLEKPAQFEFEFLINKNKYSYGFIIDSKSVIEEWLYIVGRSKDKLIFSRKTTNGSINIFDFNNIKFSDKEQEQFVKFTGKGTPVNRLFLTETNERNLRSISYFADAYDFFHRVLTIIFPESKYSGLEFNLDTNDGLAINFQNFLKHFDTGVDGLVIQEIDYETEFSKLSEKIRTKVSDDIQKGESVIIDVDNVKYVLRRNLNDEILAFKLMTKHKTSTDENIFFEINEESDGTQRLFDLIPALVDLIHNNKVYVIDELDRSLHPKLTKGIIEAFNEFSKATESQLIVTTHESSLLDLNFLRKDEIWFIEKNKSGESTAYSLEEFKPRYDKEIRKGYLLGRFGAIPFISSLKDLNWLND